jgi:hypothetical protein
MDKKTAVKLCKTFRRGKKLRCKVVREGYTMARRGKNWLRKPDHRMVFEGGKWGAHSLSVSVTSPERAQAHWRGYVENNT